MSRETEEIFIYQLLIIKKILKSSEEVIYITSSHIFTELFLILFCSLVFCKNIMYINVLEKRNLADVCVASKSQYYIESKEVRLMVQILLFLIIGFSISIAINLALLCVIYIKWVNSQIK